VILKSKNKKISYSDFCDILENMNTSYTEKLFIMQTELDELKEVVYKHDVALYKPLKTSKKSFTEFLNKTNIGG